MSRAIESPFLDEQLFNPERVPEDEPVSALASESPFLDGPLRRGRAGASRGDPAALAARWEAPLDEEASELPGGEVAEAAYDPEAPEDDREASRDAEEDEGWQASAGRDREPHAALERGDDLVPSGMQEEEAPFDLPTRRDVPFAPVPRRAARAVRARAREAELESGAGPGLRERIAAVATEEWERWRRGAVQEDSSEATPLLQSYYQLGVGQRVGARELQDGSWQRDHPWSAVFVSYVMRKAGAGDAFHYAAAHASYVCAARKARMRAEGPDPTRFLAYRISEVLPEVGDVVCKDRKHNGVCSGTTFDDVCSGGRTHGDVVVAVDRAKQEIRVIGGNLDQSVKRRTLPLAPDGHLPEVASDGCRWIAVLKPPGGAAPAIPAATGGPAGVLASLPALLGDAVRNGTIGLQVALAIVSGQRDPNTLTNMVFYARHPELPIGYRIQPGEGALVQQWLEIRDRVIKPLLQVLEGGTNPTAPAPPPTASGATPPGALAGPPQPSQTSSKTRIGQERLAEILANDPALAGWKQRVQLPLAWGIQGGSWIYPGAFFPSPEGGRTVLLCSDYSVVFSVGSDMYLESLESFQRDISIDPIIVAAKQAEGAALFANVVVSAVMAGFAATGWAAFFIVAVTQLGAAATEEQKDPKFRRLVRWGAVYLSARATLKRCTPTLYDKLFWEVVRKVLANIPEAVSPEDVATFLTSLVVGVITKRPQGAVRITATIVIQIVKAFIVVLKSVPRAMKLTQQDHARAADRLVEDLKAWSLHISPSEARQIVTELVSCGERAFDALRNLLVESEQFERDEAGRSP